MLTKPIVDAVLDEVGRRFAEAGGGDLRTDWILPRAERGEAALAVALRAATAPEVLDGGLWRLEFGAVCAVAGSDDGAFERLDLLQHSVVETAANPPPLLAGLRLFGWQVRGMEWGEAEQGDVRLCEVRLTANLQSWVP